MRANNTRGNQLSSAPACSCTSLPQPLAKASQRCPAQEAAKCGVQLYQADSRYQPIGLHLLTSPLRHRVVLCWKGSRPWSSLLLTDQGLLHVQFSPQLTKSASPKLRLMMTPAVNTRKARTTACGSRRHSAHVAVWMADAFQRSGAVLQCQLKPIQSTRATTA